MSLLDEIRDSAIHSETPVGELLRQLMVLGYRLDAEDLIVWVTAEMNGYAPDSTLPGYRPTIETHCVGDFELQMSNLPVGRDEYPISKSYFDGHDVEFLFRRTLRQPVAHYDDFLRLHPNDDMRKPWPADAVTAFRTIGYKIQRGQKMLAVWQIVPRAALLQVVEGVRNSALRFVLDIEKADLDHDGDRPKVAPETVRLLVQNNFYGSGNNINIAGNDATFNHHGDINVTAGDRESLFRALEAAGVGQDKRDELAVILDEDSPANGMSTQEKVTMWANTLGTVGQFALALWSAFNGTPAPLPSA